MSSTSAGIGLITESNVPPTRFCLRRRYFSRHLHKHVTVGFVSCCSIPWLSVQMFCFRLYIRHESSSGSRSIDPVSLQTKHFAGLNVLRGLSTMGMMFATTNYQLRSEMRTTFERSQHLLFWSHSAFLKNALICPIELP